MSFNWEEKAQQDGPQQAERIPAGEHRVRIIKIVYGTRGQAFSSRNGDPQIMPIFQDEQGREVGLMLTLSDAAGWVLAKLLSAFDPPANLARMNEKKIEPKDFAEPAMANENLVERQLTILVEESKDPKYPDVTPVVKRGDASVVPPPSTPTPPTPPPSSTPPPPPPPATEAPPAVPALAPLTKEQAWAAVLAAWDGGDDEKRSAAWTSAVRERAKPESDFTGEDWALVAQAASVPF